MMGIYLAGVLVNIGIYIEFVYKYKEFRWYFFPIILLSWVGVGKLLALIAITCDNQKEFNHN